MPIYEYHGYDLKGKSVKGSRDADSVKALRVLLKREGVLATQIDEASSASTGKSKGKKSFWGQPIRFEALFSRVSTADIAASTRQLGILLQSGVPLVDSLNALIDQIQNQKLRRIFSEIRSNVNEGMSLANALERHRAFTVIYVNMVRAGESSGALELVLERLSDYLEGQAQLQSKVLSAMTYPLVMALVAFSIMVVMLTTVVPRISQIFIKAKVPLPFMTRFLIGISHLISDFWWLILLVLGGFVYALMVWKKKPQGRARWDRLRLRVPIVGPITQLISVARFSRTLSTLLASGVPLLQSLQIVRNLVANDVLEKAIDEVRDAVREGEDIATPLKRSGCFPPMVTHMIAIGEKSGQLEGMLNRVAITYEQQVQLKITTLTSLLEPIMIVIMGGSVGFIVMAILTPIMQMNSLVK
ncbi:MAG: type II secretion system inner membrane protein GspF [Myxococcaceae bacterium]|nr:type II secretion system inner membrane protein GspF [Myxococcaceae bacterium]MBH2006487.1 type II secretion system inner membrane protein GspF [Myxococcaceae bacterium]